MPTVTECHGSLFYRGVTPEEIQKMSVPELKYWHEWHKIISDANVKAVENGG